jgi:hypothetical protein
MPELQLVHLPKLQTIPMPHGLPFGASPEATQVGAPLAQSIFPALQGSVASQDALAIQETQVPPAPHTLLEPQAVPAVTGVLMSLHFEVPAEQSSLPSWQGFVGTHGSPAAQVPQLPSLQTIPAPQGFPAEALPISRHSALPLVQSMAPIRQGLAATSQTVPAVHLLQTPSRQTESVPHAVPFAWSLSLTTQAAPPAVHAVEPIKQGAAGKTHGPPVRQVLDPPPAPPFTFESMLELPPVPDRAASSEVTGLSSGASSSGPDLAPIVLPPAPASGSARLN